MKDRWIKFILDNHTCIGRVHYEEDADDCPSVGIVFDDGGIQLKNFNSLLNDPKLDKDSIIDIII